MRRAEKIAWLSFYGLVWYGYGFSLVSYRFITDKGFLPAAMKLTFKKLYL